MKPGIPVCVTGLNLYSVLIPSLISFMAVSGRVATSKFSLMRLGAFEVVRRAVPRWRAQPVGRESEAHPAIRIILPINLERHHLPPLHAHSRF